VMAKSNPTGDRSGDDELLGVKAASHVCLH
jgi:hypothetical protein